MRTTCSMFLISVMATVLGAAPAAAQHREHFDPPTRATLKGSRVEMPMLTYGGRPIVQVTINGSGPYDFILDTGSPLTIIDTGLAKELKLPDLGESTISSPAGGSPVPSMLTRFDSMKVGGAVITASPGEAMDLAGFFRSDDAPRGVMSAAHFEGLLLTLDYPNERIVLRAGSLPKPNGRDVLAYEFDGKFMSVPITVAGKSMKAHLDTGSPSLLSLPTEQAKDVPFESDPVVVGRARLVDKEMVVRAATLDGPLQIGPRTYEHPRVTLMEGVEAANIGRGALEHFVVTLDQKNRRIEFAESKRASGEKAKRSNGPQKMVVGGSGPMKMVKRASPGNKRYGIQFSGIEGDVLEVRGVDPGSPAERGGLKAGDRIVELNGKPTPSLSLDDRIGALRGTPLRVVVERLGKRIELAMNLD